MSDVVTYRKCTCLNVLNTRFKNKYSHACSSYFRAFISGIYTNTTLLLSKIVDLTLGTLVVTVIGALEMRAFSYVVSGTI